MNRRHFHNKNSRIQDDLRLSIKQLPANWDQGQFTSISSFNFKFYTKLSCMPVLFHFNSIEQLYVQVVQPNTALLSLLVSVFDG